MTAGGRQRFAFVIVGCLLLVAIGGTVLDGLGSALTRDGSPARDLILGARTVVASSLAALAIAVPIGCVLGALAARSSPLWDAALSRLVELSGAVPTVVLCGVVFALDAVSRTVGLVIVLGILRGAELGRLLRGELLRVGGQEFMIAARALGAPPWRQLRVHAWPHVQSPLLVHAALTAAWLVGTETALSLMGLGLPSDVPSWARVLAGVGRGASVSAGIAAAAAIVSTTLALLVLADTIDDRASEVRRLRGPGKSR